MIFFFPLPHFLATSLTCHKVFEIYRRGTLARFPSSNQNIGRRFLSNFMLNPSHKAYTITKHYDSQL